MVLLVRCRRRVRLLITWERLESIKIPVRKIDIILAHTLTSRLLEGSWAMAMAIRNEIQSPLVLPLPCTSPSIGTRDVDQNKEGRHCGQLHPKPSLAIITLAAQYKANA